MRYPAVAGRFYPLDKEALVSEIESCFKHELGPGIPQETGTERRISAVVVPHAGYAASGMNAAHAFKKIKEDGLPEAYIVIGPDHHGIPFDFVMCSDEYLTPLGPCKIHSEIAGKLSEFIPDSVNAHRFEHSIEVEVPFLQYIDPDPHIVPIIMGRQDMESAKKLSEFIKTACKGHDVIVIASSDMSHYVPKAVGKRLNSMVLDKMVAKDIDGFYSTIIKDKITVCGYGSIATAMMAVDPKSVEVLKYSDSWDSLKYDMNSVVGYGSVAMYR
ncbi:MAG: AmmeMemoRadiSam system protein B [Candidatus Methanomethylophilaceae archaeon]|nr:AmmeMemoRadiSam system protein B [Candidatus Methanomethylophilaceae archaeon]